MSVYGRDFGQDFHLRLGFMRGELWTCEAERLTGGQKSSWKSTIMRAGLNAESTVMVVQVLVDETNCVAARNKIMRCRRAETRNERMREAHVSYIFNHA